MTPSEIAQVRETLPVATIAENYGVRLHKVGANLVGCCPFHKEKTGSFTIHPTKNVWRCFGCGAGGDGIRLIEGLEGVRFPAAVRIAADLAGITITDEPWDAQRARQYRIQREAAQALGAEAAWVWREYRMRLVGLLREVWSMERAAEVTLTTDPDNECAWWWMAQAPLLGSRLRRKLDLIDEAPADVLLSAYEEVRGSETQRRWADEQLFRREIEAVMLGGVNQHVEAA